MKKIDVKIWLSLGCTKNLKSLLLILLMAGYMSGFSQISIKEKKGKWALVENKKNITEYQFDEILNNYNDYFVARKNDKWGVLNKNGKVIVPFEFDAIKDDLMGFLIVKKENKYGVIDTSNKVQINLEFYEIDHFSNDSISLVKDSQNWFYQKGSNKLYNDFIVFHHPDQIALFEECSYCSKEDAIKNSTKSLLDYIFKNLKYPKEAYDQGISGIVVIAFWVTKEGDAINPRILREIGGNCGKAGMELIKEMPKWAKGAMKNGILVNSEFILPLKFVLKK